MESCGVRAAFVAIHAPASKNKDKKHQNRGVDKSAIELATRRLDKFVRWRSTSDMPSVVDAFECVASSVEIDSRLDTITFCAVKHVHLLSWLIKDLVLAFHSSVCLYRSSCSETVHVCMRLEIKKVILLQV